MKRTLFLIFLVAGMVHHAFSQVQKPSDTRVIFSGIIRDASTLLPLPNSQIVINRSYAGVSDNEGTFAIKVNRNDTIVFSLLGYKSVSFIWGDTLTGDEFIGGVYMNTDTLSIGEVVILPRLPFLKSDILKSPVTTSTEMENAKYNMAVSAYQGRIAMTQLGNPAANYSVLQQKQMVNAIDKGGIPSDKMLPLNPLLLIPAAYLLIHGFPQPEPPMKANLSKKELDQVNRKYLESQNIKR
jgi:hypothetical protein